MINSLNYLVTILVIIGAAIMIVALIPVSKLIIQLPKGLVRNCWVILCGLIVLFIGGYLVYAVILWQGQTNFPSLVVSMVFFFGACFVGMVNLLSLRTAQDVKQIEKLKLEVITDSLMGVYNRRYMDRRLEEEVMRSRRYELPLSVLIIDIDHFKLVNDTYGHPVGDLVLQSMAKLIQNTVRSIDIVARYGGEEVIIIAPNTDLNNAAILAERLRKNLENEVLVRPQDGKDAKGISITVSIGVTSLAPGVGEARAMILSADEAMYRAKNAGRNRIAISEIKRIN